ncbi:thioredoxin family protein [Simiduia sp. 21SJ11W-1]|uniref:TlpA family protein disulfide reductase n=1 Tax=Simiduia sp. 21SJ11W-1 TaxID=2909669 RepID=UPI00209E3BA6|nr:thioredoxin family protein [Simiduia sp. 21SJ11W-1]UTA47815.1 thioredoxin family protein [Simiduia sp. 21SJ11W-1]
MLSIALCTQAFAADDHPEPAARPLLIGEVSAEQILAHPAFSPYRQDTLDAAAHEALLRQRGAHTIEWVLLFGSWCHDSQREVPQILALANQHPTIALTAIAVDEQKRAPAEFTERYKLKYTPTLIVFKDGVEVGRIIERPDTNWAADIAAKLDAAH